MSNTSNCRVWLGAALVILVVVVGAGCGGDSSEKSVSGTSTENPCGVAAPSCGEATPTQGGPSSGEHTQGDLGFASAEQDGASLGNSDAPVKIELWVNFLCGHCRDFSYNALPAIVETYVSTGDAHVTVRNAALGSEGAIIAHQAAACASDQGKFWEAFDALFLHFSADESSYTADAMPLLLDGSSIDLEALGTCLAEDTHRSEIEADLAELEGMAIQALPVVVVNDQMIQGPETFADVQPAIDAALAAAGGG